MSQRDDMQPRASSFREAGHAADLPDNELQRLIDAVKPARLSEHRKDQILDTLLALAEREGWSEELQGIMPQHDDTESANRDCDEASDRQRHVRKPSPLRLAASMAARKSTAAGCHNVIPFASFIITDVEYELCESDDSDCIFLRGPVESQATSLHFGDRRFVLSRVTAYPDVYLLEDVEFQVELTEFLEQRRTDPSRCPIWFD